jgi:hypothetical protein
MLERESLHAPLAAGLAHQAATMAGSTKPKTDTAQDNSPTWHVCPAGHGAPRGDEDCELVTIGRCSMTACIVQLALHNSHCPVADRH